jgi:hypothetical protein
MSTTFPDRLRIFRWDESLPRGSTSRFSDAYGVAVDRSTVVTLSRAEDTAGRDHCQDALEGL